MTNDPAVRPVLATYADHDTGVIHLAYQDRHGVLPLCRWGPVGEPAALAVIAGRYRIMPLRNGGWANCQPCVLKVRADPQFQDEAHMRLLDPAWRRKLARPFPISDRLVIFERDLPADPSGAGLAGIPRLRHDPVLFTRRFPETIEQLQRCLSEAMLNALTYGRTRIHIRLALDGPTTRLLVEDDGPGIRAVLAAHHHRTKDDATAILRASRLGFTTGGGGSGLYLIGDSAAHLAPSRLRISSGIQTVEISYPVDHRDFQLATIELPAPIIGTAINLETSAP